MNDVQKKTLEEISNKISSIGYLLGHEINTNRISICYEIAYALKNIETELLAVPKIKETEIIKDEIARS